MKPIKGYSNYFVCPDGRIWAGPSNKRPDGCYLRPWNNGKRLYQVVMLYKDGKSKHYLVHRLVAKAFVPNPKKLPEVNHINGDVTDNRFENLEWVTSKGNKAHAWGKGLYSHNKLTKEQVGEIRKLYASGMYLQRELAVKYNVSQVNISLIVRGKGGNHIT